MQVESRMPNGPATDAGIPGGPPQRVVDRGPRPVAALSPTRNVLALVHLPTLEDAASGVGRSVRQMTEHLALRSDIRLRILADRAEQESVLPRLGEPWTSFPYRSFALDSARQQVRWLLLDRPRAEVFWPEAQIVFCTEEAYVPTRSARLVVSVHGSSLPGATFGTGAGHPLARLRWSMLSHKLSRRADRVHVTSEGTAERLLDLVPELRDRIAVIADGVAPRFLAEVTERGRTWIERCGLRTGVTAGGRGEGGEGRPFILLLGDLPVGEAAAAGWKRTMHVLGQSAPGLRVVAIDELTAAAEAKKAAGSSGIDLRIIRLPADACGAERGVEGASAERGAFEASFGVTAEEAMHALAASASVVWSPMAEDDSRRLRLLEAMAAGAPVVAAHWASNPAAAGEAAMLVQAGDGDAQAEAILSVWNGDGRRAGGFLNGRQRAGGWTWAASATAMKQVFDALL